MQGWFTFYRLRMANSGSPVGVPYWRLSGFYFLFFITVGIYLPYWSLYLKSIGFDAEAIGILSAIVVITKIFSTYMWGWIVDHTGKRMRVIRVASLLSAISFVGILFIQSFWGMVLFLSLFSVFWSASLPQIEAATLTHLGESNHTYTGIRVWGSIGFIFTVSLFGVIFEYINIGNVPVILLVSMIVVWLMSLVIPDIPAGQHEQDSSSLKEILYRPHVISFLVICFLMLVSHGPYYTFYSIYLEAHGYSSTFIGEMWALGVIAEVVMFMVMHSLVKYLGLRTLMLTSLLLAAIRWFFIGYFVKHLELLIFAQLLHAATFGIYHAVAIQYVHGFFKGKLQGRGQALYSSVSFGAGMAIGSLLSGYAWDRLGSLFCFNAAAVIALIALVIAWRGLPTINKA